MPTIVHNVYFSDGINPRNKHFHDDCHQIIFVTNGSVDFEIDKCSYHAKAGNIVIISRFESHAINNQSPDYQRYILQISPHVYATENKLYALFFNRPSGFCNVVDISAQYNEITSLFATMVLEKNSNETLKADMLGLLVEQLIIKVYRLKQEIFGDPEEKFDLIFQIQRRFERHCKRTYSLRGLADEFHISPSTLSHSFKKATGFSVFEYLNACRFAMAKNYLRSTEMTIGEIVEQCGFSCTSNFSRSFKKLEGVTPLEFRKQNSNPF